MAEPFGLGHLVVQRPQMIAIDGSASELGTVSAKPFPRPNHSSRYTAVVSPPECMDWKLKTRHRVFLWITLLVFVKYLEIGAEQGLVCGPKCRGEDQGIDVPSLTLLLRCANPAMQRLFVDFRSTGSS